MYKDIKNKIINTSYKLFQEKGYDNVSVQDICDVLSITKPTFYKHIGAKENLLASFYNNIMSEVNEQLLEMVTKDNYWEQICCGFMIILGHSQEFGQDLYSQLFISNLRENKGTFTFIDSLTNAMVAILEKAQSSGQIHNMGDPYELYMACAHLSFGYGVLWCLNNGTNDLLHDFRKALSIVLQVDEKLLQGIYKC